MNIMEQHIFTKQCFFLILLKTIPRLWGDDDQVEVSDLECFVDLLKQMLMTNQFERITPGQILKDPFITMSHFEGPFKNSS